VKQIARVPKAAGSNSTPASPVKINSITIAGMGNAAGTPSKKPTTPTKTSPKTMPKKTTPKKSPSQPIP
jgi:hypothetical protein